MFEEEEEMELKYNNFYAHLEILESEEMYSDLDNLESILNERVEEGHYDVYCFSNGEKGHERRNERASEIPTVYLVTCRKTEHLPEFQFWTKENNLSGNKEKNNELSNKKNLNHRQEETEWKAFLYTSESFKHSQQSYQNLNKQNEQHKSKKFVSRDRRTIFGSDPEEIKWKTDFIILRREKSQSRNKKQNQKIMHKFYQMKEKGENYIYLDRNTSNYALNVSKNIMNIVEEYDSAHFMEIEQEISEKSYRSHSSNSLSIKSGNLRMISERILEMNEILQNKQEIANNKHKDTTKRERNHDLLEESDKRKYSQGGLNFPDKVREQENMAKESNLWCQTIKRTNKGMNSYPINEINENSYCFGLVE